MTDDDLPPARIKQPLTPERKAQIAAADYPTGYGKPPKAAQFQKGVSGNPSGRPKAARSLHTDLLEVLDITMVAQLPDGPHTVSMQKAVVLATAARAAKGEARSAAVLMKMIELAAPERLKDVLEVVKLDPTERALISSMLAEWGLDQPGSPLFIGDDPQADDDGGGDDEDWDIL